jgi:phospholipid-binding lipoprotein MlaA
MKTIDAYASSLARLLACVLVATLAGCATAPPGASANDPLESVNRKTFAFNDVVDAHAIRPVSEAYVKVVPAPVRTGVHNIFGNFSDAWSTVNELLQLKLRETASMGMRVLTNTTIGIGGLFDPTTRLGFERKREDFGQTLGYWGVPAGPYLVLPLFGPSDVRDALSFPVDSLAGPGGLVGSTWQKVGVGALGAVDTRSSLLAASDMLDAVALDRYVFVRDAYVARRRSLVHDGELPYEPAVDEEGKTGSAAAARPSQAASAPSTDAR